MKKVNFCLLLLLTLITVSCRNKDLCEDGSCIGGNVAVKVVVNWENQMDARAMRMNIFSQTKGIGDYGVDYIPTAGEKIIKLVDGASYLPYCYDYYANVFFRNEDDLESFQAYCVEASRATYNALANPVRGEKTVEDPGGDFFVHSWLKPFDVVFCEGEELIINFYPKNILRQFTYRINNIEGAQHIGSARGAISGMAATYFFYTDKLTSDRSTVLFENATAGVDATGMGYIEGVFYTFGPVAPYRNRYTIEIISKDSKYYSAYWDVADQITESMTDREAKLAKDGYDILLENNGKIPEIPDPGDNNTGSGFEVEVGDWDDVEIFL